jgi:hypothetical protein
MNQPDELNSLHGAMSLSIPAVYLSLVSPWSSACHAPMHLAGAGTHGIETASYARTYLRVGLSLHSYSILVRACMHGTCTYHLVYDDASHIGMGMGYDDDDGPRASMHGRTYMHACMTA